MQSSSPFGSTQTHILTDGRHLSFRTSGDGPVVLYCHGWPASGAEAMLVPKLPVRIISPDRPGYGGSSKHPAMTFPSAADDIASLLGALGYERVHVIGVSGGAPYALAIAAAMPQRILSVNLISPLPPLTAIERSGSPLSLLYILGRSRLAGTVAVGIIRQLIKTNVTGRYFLDYEHLPDADKKALTPALIENLLDVWREGLGQGVHGAIRDAQLYASAWNIALSELRLPVTIWHGARDTVVPESTLQVWKDLPNGNINIYPQDGHYSVALTRTREIMAHLVESARA